MGGGRKGRKGGRVGTLTNRRMDAKITKRPSTKDKLEKRGRQNTGSNWDAPCPLSALPRPCTG